MKKLKKESGAVSVLVIVTILFMLAILTTAYVSNSVRRKAQLQSQIDLRAVYAEDMDNVDEIVARLNARETGFEEAKLSSMFNKASNTEILVDGKVVTIPAKYKIAADSGTTLDEGIVITDEVGNEWVWVPVEVNAAGTLEDVLYTKSTISGGTPLCGTTGVTTDKYSKSDITSWSSRSYPGTVGNREPDLLINKDNDTRVQAAGFTNLLDMAQTMVTEYYQMIESIEEYGGFYIGRFELSGTVENPKVQRGTSDTDLPLTNASWYNLYKACKKLSANEGVAQSRMIWGCQWDATCKFISTGANGKNIQNSSTWGNYSNYNSSIGATSAQHEGYEAKAGTKAPSGTSENWKAKNIYDMAGNIWDLTQEAAGDISRNGYGGRYADTGNNMHIGRKYPYNPYQAHEDLRYSPNFNTITRIEAGSQMTHWCLTPMGQK